MIEAAMAVSGVIVIVLILLALYLDNRINELVHKNVALEKEVATTREWKKKYNHQFQVNGYHERVRDQQHDEIESLKKELKLGRAQYETVTKALNELTDRPRKEPVYRDGEVVRFERKVQFDTFMEMNFMETREQWDKMRESVLSRVAQELLLEAMKAGLFKIWPVGYDSTTRKETNSITLTVVKPQN